MQNLRQKFEDFPSTSTAALEEGCGIKKEEVEEGEAGEEEEEEAGEGSSGERGSEPAHHARRPMNAFLIFCKRHRGVVRERYPHLENRQITKILGEWWANLEQTEKASYTDLAKQYKEAFLRANPDFKWYKLPAPPLRTLMTRPSNQKPLKLDCQLSCGPITPGKLADETQMGGLSSLISSPPTTPTSPHIPKPPKKRYLEAALANQACAGEMLDVDPTSSLQQKYSEVRQISSNDKKDSPSGTEEVKGEGNNSSSSFASPYTKLRSHANRHGQPKGKNAVASGVSASSGSQNVGKGLETTINTSQQQVIDRVVDRLYAGSREKASSSNSWNLNSEYKDLDSDSYTSSNVNKKKDEETNSLSPLAQVSECKKSNSASQIEIPSLESVPCDSYSCDKMSEADSAISSRDDLNSSFGEGVLTNRGTRLGDEEEIGMEDRSQGDRDDSSYSVSHGTGHMGQSQLRKSTRDVASKGKASMHNLPSSSSWSTPPGEVRRKSLRACKGKRYQEFMNEGRIARGKRTRRPFPANDCFEYPLPSKERRDSESSSSASEKTDSAFSEGSRGSREPDDHSSSYAAIGTREPSTSPQGMLIEKRIKEYSEIEEDASIVQTASYGSNIPRSSENVNYGTKSRKHSETSEESFSDSSPKKRFKAADFNLDEKIEALPSLSLEEFQLKKKAKKKRNTPSVKRNTNTKAKKDESQSVDTKVKMEQESVLRTEGDSQQSSLEAEGSSFSVPLVGSQKRKARKQCITRLDPEGSAGRDTAVVAQEVLNNIGLATLAEVAAAKKRLTK